MLRSMLPAGDPATDYLCDFENRAMAVAVRDSFAKLGLPTQGHFADIAGPGPTLMVRMIRNPTGAHPRAAVFLTYDSRQDARTVVVATYRPEGHLDKSLIHVIDAVSWENGEPEAIPLAQRGPRARSGPARRRTATGAP